MLVEIDPAGPCEPVVITSLRPADSPRLQGEDADHIRMLAESELPLPPIVVHRPSMRIVDGVHRVKAAISRGRQTVEARFVEGTDEEMFLLAVRLNLAHGLPLSLYDRRAAAARILISHPQWSDRAIAAATGLAAKTVSGIRRDSAADVASLRIGRDGKRRPLSSVEGRRSAGELVKANPRMPLRQIAKQAGISLGTAADVRERVLRGEDPVPAKHRAKQAAEPIPQRIITMVMEVLLVDPSLRDTESGRGLLRWLASDGIGAEEWQALVDEAQGRGANTVADIARQCSDSWREFAERLEQRAPA
ncbi:ParB N-terminal domain-containing protein [Kibdelosporangium philippinense]|uniref:ParB N-terminal domain-containing protein n=1 Tax=Kibdelosporangium philippinense TaxID=211113 RepID=A0ABS8Z8Y2_9PSEU|nr:ParB N-terminal domain-containing protein [Kibdelosporangium philippinense]MCE7004265.1 ParB N-terminal domain-containing protein [Kibdelosporangium philippinense]